MPPFGLDPGVRAAAVGVVLAALLAAGCSDILVLPPSTTFDFACAALDHGERFTVQSWLDDDLPQGLEGTGEWLRSPLSQATGRTAESIRIAGARDLPARAAAPGGIMAWAADQDVFRTDGAILMVAWVPRLEDANATGTVAAPGVVVLAHDTIAAAASAGRTFDEIGLAVLLHHVGHALGAINLGIPVQDPDIQVREGPPHHDPDPDSVLHRGWDDVRTVEWHNGPYDRFPAGALADWAAARSATGACR